MTAAPSGDNGPLIHKHEKIRFRRTEIAPLDDLPSAGRRDALRVADRPRRGMRLFAAALSLVVLAFVAGLTVVWLAATPERIDRKADAALSALFGRPIDARFAAPRLAWQGFRLISVAVDDVALAEKGAAAPFVTAGSLTFGLRIFPLLRGKMEFGSATIADARLETSGGQGTGLLDGISGEDGLVDGDRAVDAVYGGIGQIGAALSRNRTESLSLENVQIVHNGASGHVADIASLVLSRSSDGQITADGDLALDGQSVTLSGMAAVDAGSGRVNALDVSVRTDAMDWATSAGPAATLTGLKGVAAFSLKGSQDAPGEALTVQLAAEEAVATLYDGDTISGGVTLDAVLAKGSGKLEIASLSMDMDRTKLRFHGAVGPQPVSEKEDTAPAYRFELLSDGSIIEPDDSGEPAMAIFSQASGHFTPGDQRLSIDRFTVRAPSGEVFGSASATFAEKGSPSVYLEISVPEMAVADAKQLWPVGVAVRARAWVLRQIYGGEVRNGRIMLATGPGRIFAGSVLTPEEVSGHFEIKRARADIAGTLPPLRDSVGTIEFHGSNVDIALEAGTVFMPTGRTVDLKSGSFTIRDAHVWPVFGELDIKVAGGAPAILELSSYEPINALTYLKLAPEDLSGSANGTVTARIPLGKNFNTGTWDVGLTYSGLGIAKGFEGQSISNAAGTIRITPEKAVIKADAKLNGVPAQISMVEPLKAGTSVAKVRDISLLLDDKARNGVAPGLSGLLKGTINVKLAAGYAKAQNITADLTKAKLSLPWVGWSKGAGIPAKAEFALARDSSGLVRITDFVLSGETFNISGDMTVSGGNLVSAKFGNVRLNRGDSANVHVTRDGKGYSVKVGGKQLDARALVKQVFSDATNAPGAATSVKLTANLESLTGFNGEVLSDVTLSYSGTGTKVSGLKVDAVSKSGGKISISNGSDDGARKVKMTSADAGAILRFLDIYDKMRGGSITLDLAAKGDGPLTGQIDARDFQVIDEPRLASVVTTAKDENGENLTDKTKGKVDVSKVKFERGFTRIEQGTGYLKLSEGVLRGPVIGATYQGTLYDAAGKMNMTGVFMPAYGLNRIFGELPIVGEILGNGRDKGLLGITFRLDGKAGEPDLHVNPMSLIAPGIFRQIFEFR